jgi:glyoxylase-like metal-dependent hydrolase (beta-lactamase superfamily II)
MIRRLGIIGLAAACGAAASFTRAPLLVDGSFQPGRGPDGNSVFLDAPRGLILVDTGRHPAHQERLLEQARRAGKPIVAIVNTHWHLDHTGGNAEILAAYPKAEIVATSAVEGALVDFFPKSRSGAEAFLASGQASPEQRAEIERDFAAVDAPQTLRPTRPIATSGSVEVAGRTLDVHVAKHAATAADLWLVDDATHTVIAGDLVVAPVPFLDTACARGWQRALGEIAATRFDRLIPGHGAPMSRADFDAWRAAFDGLVACAASPADTSACIDGWRISAAAFIPTGDEARIGEMVKYYVEVRLRDAEAQRQSCEAR